MPGPFIHDIDPIIFSIAGVHIWWYGLSFGLGFLSAHLFLRRNRERLGLTLCSVYDLTLFFAIGVLIGGRFLIVAFNEWNFYREFPHLIPSIWIGGFATHGLIVGGAAGVLIFCVLYRAPVRRILDVLAISAAVILGFGRIGNFIDGQIYGTLTDLPWGVQFPDVEGFRHPVVLYDGLKNFLLVPILLWVRSRNVPAGRVAALFVILYAILRIPIDLLRDYPNTLWGLPNGQTLNIIMVSIGVAALAINIYRSRSYQASRQMTPRTEDATTAWRPYALAACCLIPLLIPSDATRDVPEEYGGRHPGLVHSSIYPAIAEDLKRTSESGRR